MPPLYILNETSVGYGLFKATDKKLLKRPNYADQLSSAEHVCRTLGLKGFQKWDSATQGIEEVQAVSEGKVTPLLSKLLEPLKDERKAALAVVDPKLGNAINKLPGFQLAAFSDSTTQDLFRAMREHIHSLLPQIERDQMNAMQLGLAHSVSRYKLKFSAEKVDQMIIQAISMLDDLDKQLNILAMRVKEWYGWHFPEMAKILNDNMLYARVVISMGRRANASDIELSDFLPEELETQIKSAANVSMGTDITDDDFDNIRMQAEELILLQDNRVELATYLTSRMQAIVPNFSQIVGELIGARLIQKSGSLQNLSKSAASTIQILGSEKALFRALKTKHDTPKYGLIYHTSLVGQATGRSKGKMARMVGAKASLAVRTDVHSDWGMDGEGNQREPTEDEKAAIGLKHRIFLESRLKAMEGKPLGPRNTGGISVPPPKQPGRFTLNEPRQYNNNADGVSGVNGDKKRKLIEEVEQHPSDSQMSPPPAKKSKAGRVRFEGDAGPNGSSEVAEPTSAGTPQPAISSADKAAHKAEKAARKAEKAAKKEKKERKRKEALGDAEGGKKSKKDEKKKKRKREREGEGDEGGEKKEKKKKKVKA